MVKKYYTLVIFLLATACTKNDPATATSSTTSTGQGSAKAIVSRNYNINLSADKKNYDSVSIDVDSDGIKDFSIIAYNNTYDAYQENYTIRASYVCSLQDSTLVAITNKYANYGWDRLYNFGSGSQLFQYAGGFSAGDSIGTMVPDFITVEMYSYPPNTFEAKGNFLNCLCSYVYENAPPAYTYNESVGAFLNTTEYIGFTMKKSDGRHYGWIKISNANSSVDITIVGSEYGSGPGQSIPVK